MTGRARELVREYRAVVEASPRSCGRPRIADVLAGVDEPGALADTAGWSPDLTMEQQVELLETIDARGAPRAGARRGRARRWPSSS